MTLACSPAKSNSKACNRARGSLCRSRSAGLPVCAFEDLDQHDLPLAPLHALLVDFAHASSIHRPLWASSRPEQCHLQLVVTADCVMRCLWVCCNVLFGLKVHCKDSLFLVLVRNLLALCTDSARYDRFNCLSRSTFSMQHLSLMLLYTLLHCSSL